jgi:hypothetical protein
MSDRFLAENPDAWRKIVRNEMERRIDTKGEHKTSNSGSNFFDKILSNDRDFNQFHEAMKGLPNAQAKLRNMRLAFKNLINSYTVKTAAGQAKSSLDVPRSTGQFISKQLQKIAGGKYDKAAIEIITNPDWDLSYLPKINAKSTPAQKASYFKKFTEILDDAAIKNVMIAETAAQPKKEKK